MQNQPISDLSVDDLKSLKIWVLWNMEEQKGKLTKVPRSPYDFRKVGNTPEFKESWATYDEAVAALLKYHANGIQFALPDGLGLFDIDDKPKEDPVVQLMIGRYDSYSETSPSGGGTHILFLCDISKMPTREFVDKSTGEIRIKIDETQYYSHNAKANLEIYIGGLTNHFCTYTGNVFHDRPIRDCTQAVLVTFEKDMRKKPKMKFSPKRDGNTPDDRELWDIICDLRKQKNGEKFKQLFDDGDFSDYGSQSEADCALCALIAFRVGPDVEKIKSVFRLSALYRAKWDREDYSTMTAERGIEACNGQFHKSVSPRPPFIKFTDKGKAYINDALLAQYTRDHLDFKLVRNSGKQAMMKYVYSDGYYHFCDNNMFAGYIKQFIADYDPEMVSMMNVYAARNHIDSDLDYISQDELDADESIINFTNGLLSVSANSLTLMEHTPKVLSTIQIPCEWAGHDSPTPVFDSYMDTLTNRDSEIKQLLLEWMGACLSNVQGWRMKKALFLVGEGDTGKSQLKSLVELLLGRGNSIGIDLKEIEARFGTGSVYGTRLAGSSDMSFLSVSELKSFKLLTGGDHIHAEMKGIQGFDFRYRGLLWFCMNRLPKFGGDDGQWVYDRIMVVNCPNVIPKDQQDKQLLDKMYAERRGIVYKVVKALQKVIANGYRFSEPQSVRQARADYRGSNSTVITFFQECMCPWEGGKIDRHCTTGRIYKVYAAWCRENNNGYARTAKEFRDQLAEYFGASAADIITRQKGNSYYREYTITQEIKELYSKEYGYDGSDFLVG